MFNVFWQVSYVRCWESGCARQHSSGLTSAAVPEVGKKAGGFTVRRGKNWRFISGIHSRTSASGRRCSVNGPQFHSILAQVHGNTSSRASNALLCVSTLHSSSLRFYMCSATCYKGIAGFSARRRFQKSTLYFLCLLLLAGNWPFVLSHRAVEPPPGSSWHLQQGVGSQGPREYHLVITMLWLCYFA